MSIFVSLRLRGEGVQLSMTGGNVVKGAVVALSFVCCRAEVGESLGDATEVVDLEAAVCLLTGDETGFELRADLAVILVLVIDW